jgi:hypothetical protein
VKVDADGDGRSELREIYTSGEKLLSNEIADRQPFHVICPHPLPHKHFGQSSAEKVEDVQEVRSTLVREVHNNLYHTNRPSHNVWEQGIGENTMDDLLTTKVGAIRRFARPVQESYQATTVPFAAAAAFPIIEMWDKVKRDRTGITIDSEALSPEALKHVQSTVLAPSIEKGMAKIETIVRIFAETGFKSLFLHLHELTQKHQQKAQVVKLRNKWVQVDPREWRNRRDMTVNIGLGIGTREQNLLHLQAIRASQKDAIKQGWGNLVVTPQNWYRVDAELVKNAKLQDPALYFTNPGQNMAPPPNQEQIKLQQQQQALAAQEQKLEQRRQQLDDQQAKLNMLELRLNHSIEQRELQRKIDRDKDDFQVAMDEIRNELLDIRLKHKQASDRPAKPAN